MADQVALDTPIRHLDNVAVEISLADNLRSTIKVWVVRERTGDEAEGEGEELEEAAAGREAGEDDDRNNE